MKSPSRGGAMEVTGMSLRWWHRLRQRLRISSCNHGQWIVLQRAENLWCGGWLALEFYRSRKKPDDLWPAWRARVAVCSKCGGTLDEITFACNALGKKDSVLVSPGDYYRLLKGCGTIHDWR